MNTYGSPGMVADAITPRNGIGLVDSRDKGRSGVLAVIGFSGYA
jgi:hypothetical protein